MVDFRLPAEQICTDLVRHKHYPGVLALRDVLDRLGIRQEIKRVSHQQLVAMKIPFMAYYGSRWVLVEKIDNDLVYFDALSVSCKGFVQLLGGKWSPYILQKILAEIPKNFIWERRV